MKFLLFSALTLSSSWALGFENREYHCKNAKDGLPDNIYRISASSVGGLPYVDITRYFEGENNQVEEVSIRGLATLITRENSETLYVNQLGLEIVDGELVGCKSSRD